MSSSTTTKLISQIKTKGSFPAADEMFSNEDYLSILNSEVLSTIVPILNKVNEEYFLSHKDFTLEKDKAEYRIPDRAIASTLRDVQLIKPDGSVTSLPRLFEDERTSVDNGPQGYYLKGMKVVLSPTPRASSTEVIRLLFTRRPPTLVLPSDCAQITNISGSTLTVSAVPASFSNNAKFDIVQQSTPYDAVLTDVSVVGISGTTVSFSSLPSDIAIGDYLCLASTSPVAGVPEELVPVLVQAALTACLTAKKDKAADLEDRKLQRMIIDVTNLMQPRVKSNDVKVKSQSLINAFRRR